MLLTEKDGKQICNQLLSYTTAEDAVVSVSEENFSHLRFAANAFTTSGTRRNQAVEATVWINQKRGSASGNELGQSALKALVREAERLAKLSPIDKEYLPTLGRQTYKPAS